MEVHSAERGSRPQSCTAVNRCRGLVWLAAVASLFVSACSSDNGREEVNDAAQNGSERATAARADSGQKTKAVEAGLSRTTPSDDKAASDAGEDTSPAYLDSATREDTGGTAATDANRTVVDTSLSHESGITDARRGGNEDRQVSDWFCNRYALKGIIDDYFATIMNRDFQPTLPFGGFMESSGWPADEE